MGVKALGLRPSLPHGELGDHCNQRKYLGSFFCVLLAVTDRSFQTRFIFKRRLLFYCLSVEGCPQMLMKTGEAIKDSEKSQSYWVSLKYEKGSFYFPHRSFIGIVMQLFISKFISDSAKVCSFYSLKLPIEGKVEKYFQFSPLCLPWDFPALFLFFELCGKVQRPLIWLSGQLHCFLAIGFGQVFSFPGLRFLSLLN